MNSTTKALLVLAIFFTILLTGFNDVERVAEASRAPVMSSPGQAPQPGPYRNRTLYRDNEGYGALTLFGSYSGGQYGLNLSLVVHCVPHRLNMLHSRVSNKSLWLTYERLDKTFSTSYDTRACNYARSIVDLKLRMGLLGETFRTPSASVLGLTTLDATTIRTRFSIETSYM